MNKNAINMIGRVSILARMGIATSLFAPGKVNRELQLVCEEYALQTMNTEQLDQLRAITRLSDEEWHGVLQCIELTPELSGISIILNPDQIGASLETIAHVWVYLRRILEAHGGSCTIENSTLGVELHQGIFLDAPPHAQAKARELLLNAGELINWGPLGIRYDEPLTGEGSC